MKKRRKIQHKQHIERYLSGAVNVINTLPVEEIDLLIKHILQLKKRQGRLFLLGVGGSAANTSHAVNDFRKICNIETYAPVDNISELTARTNDDGWDTVFVEWLKTSKLKKKDAVMVFSVGGGNLETNISPNIVKALQYAREKKSTILGIISRDGGFTRKVAHASVLIPIFDDVSITPYAESLQVLLWHLIVTHPKLGKNKQTISG